MGDTPQRVGPYAIERRLGAGGMAETFIAIRRMHTIEQRVCLKRILPAYARDQTARRLFSREANITAKLRHANIVQVLDVGEDDGTPYLVMELVEGTDLDHVIELAPNRQLSPDLVGHVLSEMAHALHEAHGADGAHEGVVHRDLSPSNVLLSNSGEVKVADFGIAKALSGEKATATAMRGKFAYMAPEQLDGAALDPRADMFALGVMGYEMLAGCRPFDSESDARLVMLISKNERRSIDELAPDAPRELRETIEALLSPQKENRPANGHAVVERLAPMLPALIVARRQLGALVRAAHAEKLARAASESDSLPRDPALGATRMANVSESAPTPMAAPQTPPTVQTAAPARSTAIAALVIGLALLACVSVATLGGVYVMLHASPQQPVAAAPPTSMAPIAIPVPPPASVIGAPPTSVAIAPPISVAPPTTVAPPIEVAPPPTSVASAPPASVVVAAAEEQQGHVHVVASPWGMIWIDGRFAGRAPVDARLRPGSHRIAAGFEQPTVTRSIRVRSGGDERVELEVQ